MNPTEPTSTAEADTSRDRVHPPTCQCDSCEKTCSGDFAVRAYMAGDESALSRLSPEVASILPSLRIEGSHDAATTTEANKLAKADRDEITLHVRATVTLKFAQPVKRPSTKKASTPTEAAPTPVVPPIEHWPSTSVEFGQTVRKVRESFRLSRRELARRADIGEATLRNAETARHTCSRLVRDAIIHALESLVGAQPIAQR